MTGALIAAVGAFLSIFAPNIFVLVLTFSVLVGLGFGMVLLPSIISVTMYFAKRRALATGIAVSGSGIGTFVFAPIMSGLVVEFGWRGTMLAITAFSINTTFIAGLFRPLHVVFEEPVKKGQRVRECSCNELQ